MKDGVEQSGHSFLAYFKRATSPMAVLRLLAEKPMYGYELTQAMKQRSAGAYTISVLYPVIYRLEEQGYVEVVQNEIVGGRARSYYGITAAGRDYLEKTWKEYREIEGVFHHLMEGGGDDAP